MTRLPADTARASRRVGVRSILREALAWHLGDDLSQQAEPELRLAMGRIAPTPQGLDLLARPRREPPEHIPYSTWGERIDEIRVSDAYVRARADRRRGAASPPCLTRTARYGEQARIVWVAL